ncbi:MAG TPA: LysR family transcriptional regulator [Burkholderiales bacterium]|nr:LysR family transcriptional regulator [Burkholderiales bacterium]
MDLRDIEYFTVVAQHGHLGRAAEALGLGQPALSMSLRRLEKSAQAKLVRRTPKGVELTAVGAALLSHAGKLRLARDDLAREVADLAHGRAGHLRIGASPSNADVGLPEACSQLLMEGPKITVNVAVFDNDALLPALRAGELDIAITHTRKLSQADVAMEWFREDEFVVYCAANHRLTKRNSITLQDLAHERWAAAASASGAFGPLQVLRDAFAERGLPAPRISLVSDLVMSRLRTVARSDLLGIAVKPNVQEVATRLRLKILPIKHSDWVRRVAVAYRQDSYLSPAARRFIEILKATGASLRAD